MHTKERTNDAIEAPGDQTIGKFEATAPAQCPAGGNGRRGWLGAVYEYSNAAHSPAAGHSAL